MYPDYFIKVRFCLTIQVDDIVVSHRKGFYRVVSIETKNSNYVFLNLEQVMSDSGITPKKQGTKHQTYSAYCTKVTPEMVELWRENDSKKWKTLSKIVNPNLILEDEIEDKLKDEYLGEPEILSIIGMPESLLEKK